MKILGKNIDLAMGIPDGEAGYLLGVHIVKGECECCKAQVVITRVSILLFELLIIIGEQEPNHSKDEHTIKSEYDQEL